MTASEINRDNQHSNKEKYPYSEDIKHPHDCRLIDDMVASAKTWKFGSTKVYQIKRGNQHSNKQKFPCFDDVIHA